MIEETIEFETLFNELLESGHEIIDHKTYELIECPGIEVLTQGNKYKPIKYISRHKTCKSLIDIHVECRNCERSITVTTDHVCMIYTDDHFFENINAKNLKVGQYVSIYDDANDDECIGVITKIKDVGPTTGYVYDIEVGDESHVFYGNDVLVHNSNFLNIKCVTDWFKKEYDLADDIAKWSDDDKLKLWNYMDDYVENNLNPYLQNLIAEKCHSTQTSVLRYSMEYIGSSGIYEAKKHYAVRKIVSEGPELVDYIKYSGIELKKASVDKEIKSFLKDIYEGTLMKGWTEKDFGDYINSAYEKFNSMTIDQLALWKGYGTAREATGFLKMATGTTGISKAATYFTQIIQKMGLGKKYDCPQVGDMLRFCYILPDNPYRIECLAFKDGQWPKEFSDIFKVDYPTMFDKTVLSPLKGYLEATRFKQVDPRKQVITDIFDL